MKGSVTGVSALVGASGAGVTEAAVVAAVITGTSCAANAVGRGGSGGYSGTGNESTSTLVYEVRALADM